VILLLGGTSETGAIAEALLKDGQCVLASTATATPLPLPVHPRFARRIGRLDEDGLFGLLRESAITLVVDATHPYAEQAHRTARDAADRAAVRCIRWLRPATDLASYPGTQLASNHQEAASLSCSLGKTILLTVGSRNLAPYVSEAERRGRRLIVRVLPAAESLKACSAAGLAESDIVAERGPFSLESNRAILRRFGASVLVTKDGGAPGGVMEKLEAARLERCRVVMVARPPEMSGDTVRTMEELLLAIRT
jgi:precorrin-6A/cobalt-precorrin-6A reductase